MENNLNIKYYSIPLKEKLKTLRFWRPYLSLAIGEIAGYA